MASIRPGALKPFWRYYGGKWRAAPKYPAPLHDTIIEPFAGAAGYSCNYPDRRVVLVEKYPVVASMWRYLIAARAEEIRAIPEVQHVDDLPAWVPQEARWLVGFWMNAACVAPCKSLSAGRIKMRAGSYPGKTPSRLEGWSPEVRERVANQVDRIRHWQIIEGDWDEAPIERATYFIDPPYANRAGSYYVHKFEDYARLANACRGLHAQGAQVIVCENEGATWLPFRPFGTFKTVMARAGSREVIWP